MAKDSYLKMDPILSAAGATGTDAIHPSLDFYQKAQVCRSV